jgi:hypothetical protein
MITKPIRNLKKRLVSAIRKISSSMWVTWTGLKTGLKLLFAKDSYLVKTGLLHTYKMGFPCKPDGSPLPWMNYSVISFLESRLNKELALFEYGSGYSTLFFSRLVGRVISVEHDKRWAEKMKEKLPSNAHIIEESNDEAYYWAINEGGEKFDVVVIDGKEDRVRCVINACKSLSERGVMILDDSQRKRYKEGIDYLLNEGFKRLDFEGLKPTGFRKDRTTIFYRANNCLGI